MNVIGQFKLTTPMHGTNVNKLKVDQADQPVLSQVYRLRIKITCLSSCSSFGRKIMNQQLVSFLFKLLQKILTLCVNTYTENC